MLDLGLTTDVGVLKVVCVLRNARNEFAFALGDRKLLATLKFLYNSITTANAVPGVRRQSLRSSGDSVTALRGECFRIRYKPINKEQTLNSLYDKLGRQARRLSYVP